MRRLDLKVLNYIQRSPEDGLSEPQNLPAAREFAVIRAGPYHEIVNMAPFCLRVRTGATDQVNREPATPLPE